MRTRNMLVAIIGVLALVFGLSACGSGESDFVGTWELDSIASADAEEELPPGIAEMAKAMGMELTLHSDNTADMTFMGESVKGTWEAKDNSTAILSSDEADNIEFTLSGGKLMASEDGMSITFAKKK